jgi:hypothetical protein
MNFTFGIATSGKTPGMINKTIDSIESMMKDDYEILIIGGSSDSINRNFTRVIEFEEGSSDFMISKKKNIITEKSKFNNIVYLHDYIEFSKEWYKNFLEFGNDFDVCVTPIINTDGTRYRDWCLWKDDADKFVSPNNYLIPYEMIHLSGMMYISGAYWVAKKKFMETHKLNENLKWGQGEDVEWSLRARDFTDFKINIKSPVKLMKYKERIFKETTDEENLVLGKMISYKNEQSYKNLVKNHLSKWI